ncbi:hypothetical protein JW960_10460 [candidate division KSB1 bacterium]|nr:hypothetical protein [candidate division KSB1 bacterium]
MVTIFSLWLPILLSAVFVFIVSAIIHMALPYHRSDFTKVPNESKVMEALRQFKIPPGEYMLPRAATSKDMKSPEYQENFKLGPRALLNVMKMGHVNMAANFIGWFVFSIVVSIFAAYISSRALDMDATYLSVFRFSGATAFIAYSMGLFQESIWYNRKWSSTFKSVFDGFIYALITGATFGWLWPA